MSLNANQIQAYTTDKIRSFDMFPQPISLTYNGDQKYRTFFGGLTSLWVVIFVIGYAFYLIEMMTSKREIQTSKNEIYRNIATFEEIYQFKEGELSFAIEIFNNFENKYETKPENFLTEVYWEYRVLFENGTWVPLLANLGTEVCTEKHFPSYILPKGKSLSNMLCPKLQAYNITGSNASFNYTNIKIIVDKWDFGTWNQLSYIDFITQYTEIKIYIANKFFDFKDIHQPVKSYLDARMSYRLDGNLKSFANAFIQRNEYTLQDGYFQTGNGVQGQFYSVETIDRWTRTADNRTTFDLTIYQDPRYYHYERRVFSLLQVFGQLGGANEAVTILVGIFLTWFNSKMFALDIKTKLIGPDDEQIQFEVNAQERNQNLYENDPGRRLDYPDENPSNQQVRAEPSELIDEEEKGNGQFKFQDLQEVNKPYPEQNQVDDKSL